MQQFSMLETLCEIFIDTYVKDWARRNVSEYLGNMCQKAVTGLKQVLKKFNFHEY